MWQFLDLCLTSTYPLSCTFPLLSHFGCMFTINHVISTRGCPKKKLLTECCWIHGEETQSPLARTPRTRSCFLVFFSRIEQDQALPSHVQGKIWPQSTQFWFELFSFSLFFGHSVDSPSVFLFFGGCMTNCSSNPICPQCHFVVATL